MSGVRAHNEELTKLGLTLPGFVDRNKIIASLPSLGLLTLAGLTPEKFEIEYHEIADLRRLAPPHPSLSPMGETVSAGRVPRNGHHSLCRRISTWLPSARLPRNFTKRVRWRIFIAREAFPW